MAASVPDPVRQFEHAHATLTNLTFEVRELIHAEAQGSSELDGVANRTRLVGLLGVLRDELLVHFANEEEGLFPFLRRHVPAKAGIVDRLESAHDTVCGSLVRLAHTAAQQPPARSAGRSAQLVEIYERFEAAYAAHSREEAGLFDEIGSALDREQRAELAEILRGL
jgi:iron-sulfur cluster repair protein YtfE (RIC family)